MDDSLQLLKTFLIVKSESIVCPLCTLFQDEMQSFSALSDKPKEMATKGYKTKIVLFLLCLVLVSVSANFLVMFVTKGYKS